MNKHSPKDWVERLVSLTAALPVVDSDTIIRLKKLAGNDDSFVPSLFKVYREAAPQILEELTAADWSDCEKVASLAHKLKGISLNIGLKQVGTVTSSLERITKDGSVGAFKVPALEMLQKLVNMALDHMNAIETHKKSA